MITKNYIAKGEGANRFEKVPVRIYEKPSEAVKAVDQEEKDDAQGDRSEPGQHRVQIGFDVRFFVHHDKLHSCRGKQESPRH